MASRLTATVDCGPAVGPPDTPPIGPGQSIVTIHASHADWGSYVNVTVHGSTYQIQRPAGIDPNDGGRWDGSLRVITTGESHLAITWTDDQGAGIESPVHDPYIVEIPDACSVVPPTTTVVIDSTTTVVDTTTTVAAPSTTIALPTPPTVCFEDGSCGSPYPDAPTTTIAIPPTTVVVQTTAEVTQNTLPATGSNTTPLLGAGAGFLLAGVLTVAAARRRLAR